MRWALLTLALALATPAGALAQGSEPVDDLDEDARLRFELGQRAYQRGEFLQAVEEFQEAYRLSGRALLLYNIYVAYRDAQRRPEAAAALRRYLDEAPGDAPNRARFEGILEALEADLAAEGAEPAPASAATSASSGSGGGGGVSAGPIVLLVAGGALGIGAGITGGLALARNDELTLACPSDVCPDESARTIQSDVETLSIVTDVMWPVSLVALGAGLIWLIIDAGSGGGESARLDAGCGPDGCVARLEGSW